VGYKLLVGGEGNVADILEVGNGHPVMVPSTGAGRFTEQLLSKNLSRRRL
jgi:hypothetical protein